MNTVLTENHLFRDRVPLPPLSGPREATQRQKFGGTPLPGAARLTFCDQG